MACKYGSFYTVWWQENFIMI